MRLIALFTGILILVSILSFQTVKAVDRPKTAADLASPDQPKFVQTFIKGFHPVHPDTCQLIGWGVIYSTYYGGPIDTLLWVSWCDAELNLVFDFDKYLDSQWIARFNKVQHQVDTLYWTAEPKRVITNRISFVTRRDDQEWRATTTRTLSDNAIDIMKARGLCSGIEIKEVFPRLD